jgi:hypothetical protein
MARGGSALRKTLAQVALLLSGSLAFQLVAERDAAADCVDVGCIVDGLMVIVVPIVVVGGVLVVVDAYETVNDIDDAASHHPTSSGRAKFEAAIGGVESAVGGVFAIGLRHDPEGVFGALAATSWPFALTMHGAWAERADPYQGFPGHAIPVAGLDLGIAAYDVIRLAKRTPRSGAYGFFEIVGAAPQVAFGVAAATGGRARDVPIALGLTALPALVAAHGIYEFARKEPDPPPETPARASWRITPTVGQEAGRRSVGLSVFGAF